MTPKLRNPFSRDLAKCEQVRGLMSDYVDEDIDDADRRRVERHVLMCRPCRRVLGNLRQTVGRLSHLREAEPPSGGDPADVAERLRSGWRERV